MSYKTVFLFVGLYVCWRLLYLFLVDPFYLWLIPTESTYRGAIAKDLIEGLKMPFYNYRPDDYAGGSLVIALLATIPFKLFGYTALSLKLVPITFSASALFFWALALSRYVGRKVAIYFALIFTFSPPCFTEYSLAAMGDHAETVLFTAVSTFLLFEILYGKKTSWLYFALLGFISGFATWFAYIYALTIFAGLLFWFLHDRFFFLKRNFFIGILSFGIGFMPWIISNFSNGFSGFYFQGTALWERFSLLELKNLMMNYIHWEPYRLLTSLTSLQPKANAFFEAINILYVFMFGVPILFFFGRVLGGAIKSLRTRKELSPIAFCIIYLMIFGIVLQISRYVALRYRIPTFPFMFALYAYGVATIEKQMIVRKWIPRILIGALIGFGILEATPKLSWSHVGLVASQKGYSYSWLGFSPVCYEYRSCVDTFSKFENTLSREDKFDLASIASARIVYYMPFIELPSETRERTSLMSPYLKRHFFNALGRHVFSRHELHYEDAFKEIQFLKSDPDSYNLAALGFVTSLGDVKAPSVDYLLEKKALFKDYQEQYWHALGQHFAFYTFPQLNFSVKEFENETHAFMVDHNVDQKAFLQGVGHFFYMKWKRKKFGESVAPKRIYEFSKEFQAPIFEGVGMGMAERAVYNPIAYRTVLWTAYIQSLEPNAIQSVKDGRKRYWDFLIKESLF
jgi:hypothetical protein